MLVKEQKNHIGRLLKSVLFIMLKEHRFFRWLEKFDGSKESLIDKSHKSLSPHQRTLSEEIVQKTLNIKRRKPNDSYMEIWLKMHRNNYVISLSSVLRILKRAKEYIPYVSNAKRNTIRNTILLL